MYKILRVPPNKDAYAKAYELLIGWVQTTDIVPFDEFYNKVDTIYVIQDQTTKEFKGVGYVAFDIYVSTLPYLNGQCWNLSILTFDYDTRKDSERYHQVYDLVFTICRDKKDKPIIVKGIKEADKCIDFINALKNNKFRIHKESDEEPIWYMIPSRFDFLEEGSGKKINIYNDADVLDEHCSFPDKLPEIDNNKESDMIPIEPPDKYYCRCVECRGCEFFTCCKPTDKCRLY